MLKKCFLICTSFTGESKWLHWQHLPERCISPVRSFWRNVRMTILVWGYVAVNPGTTQYNQTFLCVLCFEGIFLEDVSQLKYFIWWHADSNTCHCDFKACLLISFSLKHQQDSSAACSLLRYSIMFALKHCVKILPNLETYSFMNIGTNP